MYYSILFQRKVKSSKTRQFPEYYQATTYQLPTYRPTCYPHTYLLPTYLLPYPHNRTNHLTTYYQRTTYLVLLNFISSGILCRLTNICSGPALVKKPVSSEAVITIVSKTYNRKKGKVGEVENLRVYM